MSMIKFLIILGIIDLTLFGLWFLGKCIGFISASFPKRITSFYSYCSEIECCINEYEEIKKIEEEYEVKKEHRIKPNCYEYRSGLLKYRLISTEPIKVSDIFDFEVMFNPKESKIDFEQWRKLMEGRH